MERVERPRTGVTPAVLPAIRTGCRERRTTLPTPNGAQGLEGRMRARDIMTKNVWAVPSGTSAEDAWQLMREQQVHHLLVGRAAKPIGVLSARDLGGRYGAAVRREHTVDDLMARDIVSVAETETVRKVANTMRGRSIGCVLVNSGRRTTGIITVSDLLELVGRGDARPVHDVARRSLHHRVPHRKMAVAAGVW